MFVILTYDIGARRVAKIMKICRKYLRHVQRSVFEGMITEAKLRSLQKELEKKIDSEADQVCIYKFASLKYTQKEILGMDAERGNIL